MSNREPSIEEREKDFQHKMEKVAFFTWMSDQFYKYADLDHFKHWDLKYREGFLDAMDQFLHDYDTYYIQGVKLPEDE